MKWLIPLLLLFSAAWAQVTSPISFYAPSYNLTGFSVWQPCLQSPFSETFYTLADVTVACGGTNIMFACGFTNDTSLQIYGVVATPAPLITTSGAYTNTLNGSQTIFINSTSTYLYGGLSSSVTSCGVAGSGTCFSLTTGGLFDVAGYCPGYGPVFNNSNIFRAFYSDPCGGLAVGDTCSSPFGLCETGATCDSDYFCGNGTAVKPNNTDCVSAFKCSPATGNITVTYAPDNTTCPSPNWCYVGAWCQNATCTPFGTRACVANSICNASLGCNFTTQTCDFAPRPTDFLCSADSVCTNASYCDGAGSCNPLVPKPPPTDLVTCKQGTTCIDGSGWNYTDLPVGTSCVPYDACLDSPTCQYVSGNITCTSASTIPCVLPGPCWATTGCVPYTGTCNFTALPFGTPCDAGDPCVTSTSCSTNGDCTYGSLTTACDALPDPGPCYTYVPTPVGLSCNCVLTPKTDGVSCVPAVGALCATNAVCASAVCVYTPVTCPGDDCNGPLGSCDPLSGCYNPIREGLGCNTVCRVAGECYDGVCSGGMYNASNPSCIPSATDALAWLLSTLM